MTVTVLAGGKGSPGVTTTAVALGAVWPRRVLLAECDPGGSDLWPWWMTELQNRGLLTLSAEATPAALGGADVLRYTQRLPGGLEVLLGFHSREQSQASSVWAELPRVFRSLRDDTGEPVDVIVDCGRVSVDDQTMPLVQAADRLLVVTEASRTGIVHGYYALRALQEVRREVGAVVIAPTRSEAVRAVEAFGTGGLAVPLAGWLPVDQAAAAALAGEPRRRAVLDRSLLLRAARGVAAQLAGVGEPQQASGPAPLIEWAPEAAR